MNPERSCLKTLRRQRPYPGKVTTSPPPSSLFAVESAVGRHQSMVVAFSGGVDSSVVAAMAARVLGKRAVAVTAVSPALASGELAGAEHVARTLGIAHRTVRTNEMSRAGYVANAPDRCYHCKSELYDVLDALLLVEGYEVVASGANHDDLGDWRPGLRAAEEHRVVHPLMEAGCTKAEVRELALYLRVPSAAKPASPCLASRVPYGTPVDAETLARIDKAELSVRATGLVTAPFRVRHHGDLAKLELSSVDLDSALADPSRRSCLVAAVREAGYAKVAVDLEHFRSGSLTQQHLIGIPTRRPTKTSQEAETNRELEYPPGE